ncbi:MAG: cytochrome C peroxidase [Planctomycetota bacterium]|nr:cytochrome C peroxidase [Planctomycetota bacterium]
MRHTWIGLVVILAVLGVVVGGSTQPVAHRAEFVKDVRVQLVFEHAFSGAPLRVDDVALRTAGGNTISVSRLSYFVSNVRLRTQAGETVGVADQVEVINAVTQRRTMQLASVRAGDYAGIEFDIGLSPPVNHADPATFGPEEALNPLVNNMHWGWQGGYVFFALEGRWVKPDDSLGGFSYHIATDEHLMHVSVTAAISLAQDSSVVLRCDVARVLDGAARVVISDDPLTQSTHSGSEDTLALQLARNIERSFSFVSVGPLADEPPSVHPATVSAPAGTTPCLPHWPKHFPKALLPADNPLTMEGVALGKRLFFDTRLSADDSLSCASCHQPASGLSDSRKLSLGVNETPGSRNSMPLFNLAWSAESGFTWDGRRARLRDQVLAPIQDEREMHQSLEATVGKLKLSAGYQAEFEKAFGSAGVTAERLGLAVEQYLLTLISADSKFDRALDAIETFTQEEKRGLLLFVTEYDPQRGQYGADCFHCHGGNLFSDYQFRSNGLDKVSKDVGRLGVTLNSSDAGRFKTPSLRNVEKTAPYMHDGRFGTLLEVLDHYSEHVQQSASLDPNLAKHLRTTPEGQRQAGVNLSPDDRNALVAFLKTLTDTAALERAKPQEK